MTRSASDERSAAEARITRTIAELDARAFKALVREAVDLNRARANDSTRPKT